MREVTVLANLPNAKPQGKQNMFVQTSMRLNWTFKNISGYIGTFWDKFDEFLTSLEHLDHFIP